MGFCKTRVIDVEDLRCSVGLCNQCNKDAMTRHIYIGVCHTLWCVPPGIFNYIYMYIYFYIYMYMYLYATMFSVPYNT